MLPGGDGGVWHLRCTLRGAEVGHGTDAARRLAVCRQRPFPLPRTLTRPGPRHGSPRLGTTMLSVVIALLTVAAMAGSVLTLRQMRRNREVNELLLRLRMRDALLTDESLTALPIALTVHLPWGFWSPAVVEITGRVPTTDLRDDVVRLAKRELARWRTGAQTAARLVVDPLIGPRVAAGTRGMGPHVLIADDDRPSLN